MASDRGLVAALARGWVEEWLPAAFAPVIGDQIQRWQAGPHEPAQLWVALTTGLRRIGLRDAERAACEAALAILPDHPHFLFRLAEVEYLTGERTAASHRLESLFNQGFQSAEAHRLALDLAGPGDDATIRRALAWHSRQDRWDAGFTAIAGRLDELGHKDAAVEFLARHPGFSTGVQPDQTRDLALQLMRQGDAVAARRLLEPLWQGMGDDFLLGRYDGTGENPDTLGDIAALVERAFESPPHPPYPLAGAALPGGSCRVVVVGYESAGLPNDVVHHFVASGRKAGLDVVAYLDDALVPAQDLFVSDESVERRVAAFEAEMERLRPDLVVLDWTGPIIMRGLNPERMDQLKRRVGFRLACSIRDAHRFNSGIIASWLPAADAVLLFHPLAQCLTDAPVAYRSRLRVIPVPAGHIAHGDESRDLAMLFVGAVNFGLRLSMFSLLLTENIPLTAVLGEQRRDVTADMDAYFALLSRARTVLNFSAHTGDEHLVTGRVWESVASGAVLVEQDNPATRQFFTPYRHYLPWRSVDDIIRIAHLAGTRPDLIQRIAGEAQAWARDHYGCTAIWQTIIGAAFAVPWTGDGNASDDAAAWLEHRILGHWSRFHEVRFADGP